MTPLWIQLFAVAAFAVADAATAAEPAANFEEALRGLGASSRTTMRASIDVLSTIGDARALPALEALLDKSLRVSEDGDALLIAVATAEGEPEQFVDALRGEPIRGVDAASLKTPKTNNSVRRALKPVIAQLQLRYPDDELRLAAAEELRKNPQASAAPAIRSALEVEADSAVRNALKVALAQIELADEDRAVRLSSATVLGELGDRSLRATLEARVTADEEGNYPEADEEVRKAIVGAIRAIDRTGTLVDAVANLCYGLSLASVLLLAALGLAITFGLMGVINMAHGELIMLGAYTTYAIQGLFQTHLPGSIDWYVVAAIPGAFVVCGLVGMALERSVIRHLYGRPLETLLATWGISLILIQTIRLLFGAQNVEVANPTWLSGGVEIFRGVVLPWSRISIVIFAGLMVAVVWALLQKTPLGLQVRAVTQNRSMAACLGIATARVDMWTFGLGSAIAGLGGVALSQLGNVGPELGQAYIVDSFMVVVVGGVGKIAGTVVAAIGLGVVNKLLEPVSGAVLGKIFVLAFIILFIQRRPQGIFALRGRSAEA